jgi:predicted DNA-binding transcriptional regulator YafY
MAASPQHYPVRLTQAQRKVVAEIVAELAERLKLDEPDQRTIEFTVAELKIIQKQAAAAVRHASTGMKRNSLRHVADLTFQALDRSQGIGAIPVAERLYQFKITLKDLPHRSGGASR